MSSRAPLVLALLLLPAAAAGHGAFPQALSIHTREGAPHELLVATNFGAAVSKDDGCTWESICEEAVGYGAGQRPAWWLSPSGATFAGSFSGLFVARTGGCTWDSIPDFEATGCSDVRAVGSLMVATSGKYGVTNRIWTSADDGLTWLATPESSDVLFYSSARLAPSRPQRLYAAAWWFQPVSSRLLRSDDSGQSFTAIELTLALPAAGPFYVLAVYPTKPEVVFATVSRDADPRASWLLKSKDSGDTFTAILQSPEVFNSVAFGSDPRRVWAAAGNQLFESTDEGDSFVLRLSPQKNACVTTRGAQVYSCGWPELDGWAVGEGDGGAFNGRLRWKEIKGPIACASPSKVQSLCEPLWPVVYATFPAEPDAGPRLGCGVDGGTVTPPPPPPPRPCGCATAPAPLTLLAVWWFRRKPRSLG